MINVKPFVFNMLNVLLGRAIHALWLAVIALTAMSLKGVSDLNVWTGLALASLPGIAGVFLAGPERSRMDAVRFTMALMWTLPGFAAIAAFSTPLSPAALVFLAGPFAMAASGTRSDALLGGILSGTAFILVLIATIYGPVGVEVPALTNAAEPWLGFTGFLALSSIVSRLKLERQFISLRKAYNEAKPAAYGFENSPTPIVALNSNGDVIAASKSLRHLTPGAPRYMEGLAFDGFAFDDREREHLRSSLAFAQIGVGIDSGRFTFDVRGAKGEVKALQAHAFATPSGFVISLDSLQANSLQRDETMIENLKHERDEAIAANRSKSEFLASVSHELRTPLNAIIGFSDVMKQRLFGPLPARYAEYGDLIYESGSHLLELIGDVLDMSKIEADRYELTRDDFDVRDLVSLTTKLMSLRAHEHGLDLRTEIPEQPVIIDADRKAIRQILLNLLSNSVKFTPSDGTIIVAVHAEDQELVLVVSDTGVGIEAESLTKLGTAFTQSRSAQTTMERGSGLGLSLVKALVDLHDGTMQIESEPGEGTIITIRLPVLVEVMGQVETFETLEVHERIRAAQSAETQIKSTQATG